MSTAQKLLDNAYIHKLCKVGELTEAMTERLRLQLQPIIDAEKQNLPFGPSAPIGMGDEAW